VQVDERVGGRDQLVEERPREDVAVGAVVGAGEAAVEVLAVLGDDERRAALERAHADDRDGGDRAGELVRVELVHDAGDGRDRGVLAAVDPAD
jgi:hypothetical protein